MDKKKKKRSLLLSMLFLLLLFILTYFIIFRNIPLDSVFGIISSADIRFVCAAFLMIPLYFLIYGYFCCETLRFKGCRISILKGITYACTDFYFSAITPSATGGQPMAVYYMTKDKIPASAATLSTVLLTVLFKVVLILLNAVALIFYGDVWLGGGTLFVILWFFGLTMCSGVVALGLITAFNQKLILSVGDKFIRFGAKLRVIKDPEKTRESYARFASEYKQAAEDIKGHKGFLLKLIFIILVQRLAYFSVAFFVYRSFGQKEFSYFYFVAVQAFIALSVDSLPLPGGMGANEAAIIMMYQDTFGAEKAAGAMLLIRFANYYFGLIISAAFTIGNHIRHSLVTKKVS